MARRTDRPPRSLAEWLAFGPQLVGIGGLLFCLVFWAVTFIVTGKGAVEPLFVTTFGGLLTAGLGAEAVVTLKQPPPPPPPLPDTGVDHAPADE